MIPIYIPTRGGKSKQITYENLPDEQKTNVIFFVGEPVNTPAPQIVFSKGIADKRQAILEHARDNNYKYFVMVDDDCRFKSFNRIDYGPVIEYKVAKGKANANAFNRFFDRSQELFDQYSNVSLISDHNSAFVNSNKTSEISIGLSKFVLHNTDRVVSKYNRVTMFEDIDFYLQETAAANAMLKLKSLCAANKTSDYKDMSANTYLGFFRDWQNRFGPYVNINWATPSVFAGDKKIPVTVSMNYIKPAGNTLRNTLQETP